MLWGVGVQCMDQNICVDDTRLNGHRRRYPTALQVIHGLGVTSRIADWSTAVQPVELDVLAEEDAAAVARDLGAFALALEQGGAYVAKIRVSFSEYRRRWESRKEEVLAWHDERLMLYPKSVATTWQTTIEELSDSERKLLNILAWLAPEPIPLSLLEGNIVDGARMLAMRSPRNSTSGSRASKGFVRT